MRIPWTYSQKNYRFRLAVPHTQLRYIGTYNGETYRVWKLNPPESPLLLGVFTSRWVAKRQILDNIRFFGLWKSGYWGKNSQRIRVVRTRMPQWLEE